MKLTERSQLEILRNELVANRAPFDPHWKAIETMFAPRSSRFSVGDDNRGASRNEGIIDSSGLFAVRTLKSGMVTGISPATRPWFLLSASDPELNEWGPVKQYLDTCTRIISTTFTKTNLYKVLPGIYGDAAKYGTAAFCAVEDFDNVMRFEAYPIGSYWLAQDHRGRVNTFIRDFQMTVRQMISRFGKENVSTMVLDLWEKKSFNQKIEVTQIVQPNDMHNPKALNSKFKKYISIYYERGSRSAQWSYQGDDREKVLEEKGFDFFPILAPRWETNAEDVYGSDCPGMMALGDVLQLQHGESKSLIAVDKMVDPPMIGHQGLQQAQINMFPGGITWVPDRESQAGFRPLHEVRFDINQLELKQQQVRQRIEKAFYSDIFRMFTDSDRRFQTATEVTAKDAEKLLAIGSVLEQFNGDVFDPLIEIAFEIHNRQGLLPAPPKEIAGKEYKVQYISIMAQAQKLSSTQGVERFFGFVAQLAQVNPEVLDKVSFDQGIDVYGDLTSVPQGIVMDDDDVAEVRGKKAQLAAQQAQMQQMQAMASTAQTLGQTPVGEDTALSAVMR